jgi:hypothetical protein
MSKRVRASADSAFKDKETVMSVDSEEALTEELGNSAGEDAADLLSRPPLTDDLAAALAARPPKAKLPRVTLALSAAALICAGFIGGVAIEKNSVGSGGTGRAGGFNTSAFTGGRGGAGGFGGGFGGGTGTGTGTGTGASGAGNAITGTITVVSGNTLYVTSASGTVYTVTLSGTTAISIAQSGTTADLKAGQSVTIAGTAGTNGDVTATSVTAKPSGGQ